MGGFNNEDPGSSQIAQNFFGLDLGIVNATLGFPVSISGKDIAKFRTVLPKSVAMGVDSCHVSNLRFNFRSGEGECRFTHSVHKRRWLEYKAHLLEP